MAWRKAPEALVKVFHAALPDDSRVEQRKMFGYPAAFTGGYLFAGLHQEDLILRLPEEGRAAAAKQIGARPFEPMPGRVMGEFVAIVEAQNFTPARLRPWLTRSFVYAQTLPSKPAKRAKKAAAKARR